MLAYENHEQGGSHITGYTDIWYRPTYEAVYWSKPVYDADGELDHRSMTKLIFESSADVNEPPLRVDEMLSAVPPDGMRRLVEVLGKEPAVVTFRNAGTETAFTANFDKSEPWEQTESEILAVCQAYCDNRELGLHIFIRHGRAESLPASRLTDRLQSETGNK